MSVSSNKAIHNDIVSGLSTPAAYHRFVSRRGNSQSICSDNGRNFLGVSNELRHLAHLLASSVHIQDVTRAAADAGTDWHFIPPRAPHFDGLWEAAVKSCKRILKTSIGGQIPTLETFWTITSQVEAILNSRPLTAMSTSPDDLSFSPGHFLIFRPMTAPPSEHTLDRRTSFKSQWTLSQFIVRQFWRRWTKDYLLQQQQFIKWNTPDRPVYVDQLAIIIEGDQPTLHWSMGGVVALYSGPDDVVRVADVKTPTCVFRRPLRRLCPLPTQ